MRREAIDRASVPTQPGVYLFKTKGKNILYIGKAKQLKKRLQQYFRPSSLWKQDMVNKAARIERLPVQTEKDAILLETQLIQTHKPTYNNLIKGDTSYVYIKLRKEPYPNIQLSRYKKPDKARYIGPKVWRRDLKYLLQVLRQIFKYRSCPSTQFKKGMVCSDYFFGLCAGRCVYAKDTPELYEANKKIGFSPTYDSQEAQGRYQEMLELFIQFFNGRGGALEQALHDEIETAVAGERFERAAKLRDSLQAIQRLTERQEVVLDQPRTGYYCLLKSHNKRHFLVVVHLVDGKIIDVITKKEHTDDLTIQEIIDQAAREFDVTFEIDTTDDITKATAFTTRISKKHLKQLYEHATSFLTSAINAHTAQEQPEQDTLGQLEKRYNLPTYPIRIEAVDISHIGGKHTVGAISCMERGRLNKNEYRRYKIQGDNAHDDYAALKEVIMRRFKLTQKSSPNPLPDLFVIDGGKGQLGIVKQLRDEYDQFAEICNTVTFVSIGKGKARSRKGKRTGATEELFRYDADGNIHTFSLSLDEIDRLLRKVRDEAHRFANNYRKYLYRKSQKGD